MGSPKAGLGYTEVDRQPEVATVLAGMEATARSPAVQRLRAWERQRLALQPGDRVLDVGCGLGDVAVSMVSAVAPSGEVVALDASEAMLDVARQREPAANVVFRRGDALNLAEPDGAYDACRSERMLQWLSDPGRAVAEMTRVLRPGGRLSLIDTDWSTFTIDLDDRETVSAVCDALWSLRGQEAFVGTSLLNLCREAGLTALEVTATVHIWDHWDPDRDAAPAGLFPLRPVVDELADRGILDAEIGRRFLDQLIDAARRDRFFMSVAMFAVSGRRPG